MNSVTRFEIEPAYADALRAAGLADFDALMRVVAGEPTSQHRHRETVPIEIDVDGRRRRFFLKRVFKVPAQHAWRPWLRGAGAYSQPVCEWEAIAMMRAAGLPVMTRVAVGERRRWGIRTQALLLVEDVGLDWTLENWLVPGFPKPPGLNAEARMALWRAVGGLMAGLVAAGIHWWDLDAKHIFADRRNDTTRPEFRIGLVDLERVSRSNDCGGHFETPMEYATLSTLFCSLLQPDVYVTDDELAAFQAGYLAVEPGRQDAEHVRHITTAIRNEYFPSVKPPDDGARRVTHPRARQWHSHGAVRVAADAESMLRRLGLVDLDTAFAVQAGDHMRKPGLAGHRDRTNLTAVDDEGRPVRLFMKRYSRPPLGEQIRRIWEAGGKRSSARREAKAAERLNELGIATLEVAAYGQEMRGWWERRSFIVTRAVAGESLEAFATRCLSDSAARPDRTSRLRILRKLARMARRMHQAGLYHRDLYLSHVFIDRESGDGTDLALIDLARVPLCPRAGRTRWRIKDLAALAYSAPRELISRTDRVRFLRWYLCGDDRHARLDRALIRCVNQRVAAMARHDRSRAARRS